MKNFSQACENNKKPILEILRIALTGSDDVLEIGSGSGQHAMYFAEHLPHLQWQTSELPDTISALRDNLSVGVPKNVLMPIELDVRRHPWPIRSSSSIFSANTLHIMSWDTVKKFLEEAGAVLNRSGLLCVYGPFRYSGAYTSASNASFDVWLKERDPNRGIRDFEAINRLAQEQGLELINDYVMPANNQFLIWKLK